MKNTTCFVGVLRGACLLVGLLYSSFSFSQIQTVGTFANDADAYNGYTLVFPMNSKTIYLIDNCGLELHRWQTQTRTLVAYLQPNGDLIKSSIDTSSIFNVGGQSGAIERYSWDGTLLWKYEKSTNDE